MQFHGNPVQVLNNVITKKDYENNQILETGQFINQVAYILGSLYFKYMFIVIIKPSRIIKIHLRAATDVELQTIKIQTIMYSCNTKKIGQQVMNITIQIKKTNGMVRKQIFFQEGTFYKIYTTYVSVGELIAKTYCTIVNINKMDY